jgi:hypothetical protein
LITEFSVVQQLEGTGLCDSCDRIFISRYSMLKHLFVSLVVLLWNNAYSLNLGSYPNEALSRRSFMGATAASFIAAGNSLIPLAAHASYPSVTVAQFQTILQDSGT